MMEMSPVSGEIYHVMVVVWIGAKSVMVLSIVATVKMKHHVIYLNLMNVVMMNIDADQVIAYRLYLHSIRRLIVLMVVTRKTVLLPHSSWTNVI
jgi:hypothetical protein